MNQQTTVFFRNDDVNLLDPQLQELFSIIVQEGEACVDMAIEPANVHPDTVEWLLSMKHSYTDKISIITHGYDHIDHFPGQGEFGGRTYEDQIVDIRAGHQLMQRYFSDNFFPAFSCPRAGHNESTIRCLNDSGYKVFSSYHNVYLKNKLLNIAGHALGRTHLFGKRISYHMGRVPRTNLIDISMSMSLIRRYYSDHECEFPSLDFLHKRLIAIKSTGQRCIGVTVHHRFHRRPEDMRLIRDAVRMFREEGCVFSTIERIYSEVNNHV
jgi:hypothetical protein